MSCFQVFMKIVATLKDKHNLVTQQSQNRP